MNYLKGVGFTSLAFLLGFIGLSFFFSEGVSGLHFFFSRFGLEESLAIRITIAALFFFLTGTAIGFFNPTQWGISGVVAWGYVVIGGSEILAIIRQDEMPTPGAQEPNLNTALILLTVPAILSILGGYIGKRSFNRFMRP